MHTHSILIHEHILHTHIRTCTQTLLIYLHHIHDMHKPPSLVLVRPRCKPDCFNKAQRRQHKEESLNSVHLVVGSVSKPPDPELLSICPDMGLKGAQHPDDGHHG